VFTSSIAVYGANQVPMTEAMRPEPEDPYGIAKFAVEMDLEAAHRMFGLNFIVFRPHNVYGERQNIADKYRNVIGIFMNQIMRGEPLTIFGDGTQTRAFSYIGDVAPIIARSVEVREAYGETFNVGADTPYSINTLAEAVQEALGQTAPVRHLEARKEVLHAHSDHGKARSFFGAVEPVSLEEGVGRMARWALKAGPMEAKAFERIEVDINLPAGWTTPG
jgi:UDP-glucose 4-epimerase